MQHPIVFDARSTRLALLSMLLASSACPHEQVELGRLRGAGRPDNDTAGPYDELCGGESVEAFGTALELLVVLDTSATMGLTPVWGANCPTVILEPTCPQTALGLTPTLWQGVVPELRDFVNDARFEGLAVAMMYFGDTCEPTSYMTANIPMGTLPGRAAAIERSLNEVPVLADTTTRPTLEGSIAFMRQRAQHYNAHPVIVLITDAVDDGPDDCADNTVQSLSRVAAAGRAGDPPVPTYVFTLLPNTDFDQVARAAETGAARFTDLTISGSVVDEFARVRDLELAKLRCAYELPGEYARDVNDPNLVNLTHDQVPIPRVRTEADCAPTADGWYYDDPAVPSRLLVCPNTCERLKRGGSVELVLRCPTVERAP